MFTKPYLADTVDWTRALYNHQKARIKVYQPKIGAKTAYELSPEDEEALIKYQKVDSNVIAKASSAYEIFASKKQQAFAAAKLYWPVDIISNVMTYLDADTLIQFSSKDLVLEECHSYLWLEKLVHASYRACLANLSLWSTQSAKIDLTESEVLLME